MRNRCPLEAGLLLGAWLFLVGADPGGGVFSAKWKAEGVGETIVGLSYHPEKKGEGRISTQLGPDGERFGGRYLRLNGKRPATEVRGIYDAWSAEGFDDFRYGPSGAPWRRGELTFDMFRKRYSGSIVATLDGNRGSSMRCRFELVDASRGLPGGAFGLCQVSTGDTVALEAKR